MKTTNRHKTLAVIAWASFIISLFLPAFDKMPGWIAAMMQEGFLQPAIQGNPPAVHYLLLTFANLVMIVSPFFMAWGVEDGRFVKWLRWLSLAATLLVWLFLGQLWAVQMAHDLKIGYYLWAGSFVVLSMAAWLQPATVKAKVAEMV